MKIVTYSFGKDADPFLLSSWLYHYTESKTTIPCVLFYDRNVSSELLKCWPYEKIMLKHNINIDIPITDQKWYTNLYCDIMKMLIYKYVGPSIVVDNDAIIKKAITIQSIPVCNWGLVKKRSQKNYIFHEFGYPRNFTMFEEVKNVDDCFTGCQIIYDDYFDLYIEMFKKYSSMINSFYSRGIYGEAIACLCHRLANGTFLAPEWDWMFDRPESNDNVIIEHYPSPKGKELLKQKTFNVPSLITYKLTKS